MNTQSQQLLESFDQLPEEEKQQVVAEILRRTLNRDITSLTESISGQMTFSKKSQHHQKKFFLMMI